MRRPALFLAALAVTLAGCGGTHHTPKPAPIVGQSQVQCPPPKGQGYMGVCAKATGQANLTLSHLPPKVSARPTGGEFPDVSSWQGYVNWGAVKAWQQSHGWRPAGIFKMGEYSIDPYASHNNAYLAQQGMWRAGYWFVRNTGCGHEASQIVSEARALGLKVVVLDMETGEAAGYGHCLAAPLRAAGLAVLIYTAPGTWPGGPNDGLPLWVATFGSGFGCVWTCHPVAWQFTDGTYGNRTYVPGIGYDDVNVDYGITNLGAAPPPPPLPKCLRSTFPHTKTCYLVRFTYNAWKVDRDRIVRQAHAKHCVLHVKGGPSYCDGWRYWWTVRERQLATYRHLFL